MTAKPLRLPRYSRFIVQRLGLLLAANLLVLLGIWILLQEGASFSTVLFRAPANVAPTVLAGLGVTGLIFTGAIDLSIASIITVAGTVFGVLVFHGFSPVFSFAACFLTAWGLSFLNGLLVRRLQISAIILTLAGLAFYRGIALMLADISIPNFGGNISVPGEQYHAPGKQWASAILAMAVLIAILWEMFGRTPRTWLALGNSQEACQLSGLNPGRILQSAFSVGGAFLGLAALLYTTRIQAVEPARMALGFELQVIGGVVIGGTNIFGGEGSYAGTVLGCFFLYFVSQLLVYAGVSPYFQDVIVGTVILGVIGLDCGIQRQRKWLEELA